VSIAASPRQAQHFQIGNQCEFYILYLICIRKRYLLPDVLFKLGGSDPFCPDIQSSWGQLVASTHQEAIMKNKLVTSIVVPVVVIFLLAALVVQPAGATPPEELNFTVEIIYAVPSSSTTFGSWASSGVLESAGGINESIFFAGWNKDNWFVRNPHTTILLSDAHGTIMIKAQLHEDNFEPFGLAEFTGNWVIVDGTGDYAGLHGQGALDLSGMFYWSCPANAYGVTGPCLVETRTYTGKGHFNP
jgi:hypothetical protein